MSKVLVTTIRSGGGRNSKNMKYRREKIRLEEYENDNGEVIIDAKDSVLSTNKTGIRDDSYDRKEFGENLNPLARFIRSRVKKPWDKVYSEICEYCSPNGAVSGHVFDHLWDLVIPANRVFIQDNEPWENCKFGKPRKIQGYRNGIWGQFYVDPRDGILREAPKIKKIISAKPKDRVRLSESSWAWQGERDIWFILEFRPQEYNKSTYLGLDGKKHTIETPKHLSVHSPIEWNIYPFKKKKIYLASCKSASKKEIKKILSLLNE